MEKRGRRRGGFVALPLWVWILFFFFFFWERREGRGGLSSWDASLRRASLFALYRCTKEGGAHEKAKAAWWWCVCLCVCASLLPLSAIRDGGSAEGFHCRGESEAPSHGATGSFLPPLSTLLKTEAERSKGPLCVCMCVFVLKR